MTSRPTDESTTDLYDVVLLGGHLATGLIASILACEGLRVAVLTDPHDRHQPAGETTIPYTAELFFLLGARFDLPQVTDLAMFPTVPEELQRASGQKLCLSFAHHAPGAQASEDLQFVVPAEHAEWHPYRPALDSWSMRMARGQGATIAASGPHGAPIRRRSHGWDVVTADETVIATQFLIDATGRHDDRWLRQLGATWNRGPTRSRLFHWHQTAASSEPPAPAVRKPMRWSAGTSLHGFPGGALQLIKFDNHHASTVHLTGASLTLTGEMASGLPERPGPTLEALSRQYPSLGPHVAHLEEPEWESQPTSGGYVTQPLDAPLLMLERSACSAPDLLSGDISAALEIVYATSSRLLMAFRDGVSPSTPDMVAFQRDVLAKHGRWAEAAVRCAAAWPTWNALLRVWLLWTIMGALSIKRTRLEAATTDGWDALDARLVDSRWYSPPRSLALLVDDALDILTSPLATTDPRGQAACVFDRLSREAIVPPLFDFADPEARSYRFTLVRRLRMLRWAKLSARREFSP